MNTLVRSKRLGLVVAIMTLVIAGATVLAIAQAAEEGTANFYNDKFQGKKTSSGEVYDKNGMTASHKSLPYGTKVKVTNVANGKSVVVTINDRMRKSDKAVIDVTRKAAEELGFAKSGKAKVKLEVAK